MSINFIIQKCSEQISKKEYYSEKIEQGIDCVDQMISDIFMRGMTMWDNEWFYRLYVIKSLREKGIEPTEENISKPITFDIDEYKKEVQKYSFSEREYPVTMHKNFIKNNSTISDEDLESLDSSGLFLYAIAYLGVVEYHKPLYVNPMMYFHALDIFREWKY